VAALETVLGVRLFERSRGRRTVSLTEAGELFLGHVVRITNRLQAARADLLAYSAGEIGTLRVGVYASVGARILPGILRRFEAAWPGVEVQLSEAPDQGLLDAIELGTLDLTFGILPLPAGPFGAEELARDPYVLVVPAGSPLAATKRPPSLKEIALQPLVGFNHCTAMDQVESQLASSGRRPNYVFRSDNNGTVQGLVGAGVGVSVAPLLTVDEDDERIVVVDLQGRIEPRVIGLVWHADRAHSPAAEAFVQSAVEVCLDLRVEPAAA